MALLMLALAAMPGVALAGLVPGELPAHVGRLSTVAGEVRWFDRDSQSWLGTPQEPLRNWPVAAGDRLRTGFDGRAELRLGNTTLRLGPGSDLTLQRLDGRGLVLWLESGTLALRVSKPLPGEGGGAEVQTAEGRWRVQAPGHYRIARQADARTPATLATTWRGEMSFEGRDSALTVPAGRRADIWLDPASRTRYDWAPVERDAFADWVARDERLDDAPVSARYVPQGMTGWQDLDRNGDWVSHPEYGQVWQPRQVAVGWAPFHDGRWAWVAPWGWTWIDAAPWGFAPFHYGSWVVWQDRWCWSPGPRHERPHYAPALRAWTGGAVAGGGTNIGININIGDTAAYRPPPPRVVIPVVLSPRMVVAPPTIVVINPPPRAGQGDPGRVGPPPPVQRPQEHEHERRGRYDPAPRDLDRRLPDGRETDRRDTDRRDPGRHDPDRRDPDRREPDRRDHVGPVTAAPAPVPAAPAPAVPAAGPAMPAPVAATVGPAAPTPVGLTRRFTPPAPPAPPAPPVPPAPQAPTAPTATVTPVANAVAAQAPTPAAPRPLAVPAPAAPRPQAAPTPPAPTPPAPRPHDAEPGRRTDASQRPDRGDHGDRGDRGTAVR